jgi:hypothetical protein
MAATLMPMSADEHSARKSEQLRASLQVSCFPPSTWRASLYLATPVLGCLYGFGLLEKTLVPRDLSRPDQFTRDTLWNPKTVR